ncbi:uncharacterized protein EI97DRAFT_468704 [Westerdykella ornata]|uniref:Nucleoporin Nup120/160 n=1 Tax=Westerdykella ornata TaxID=318751 RepID=A0A6A6JD89_WESOR|nr:uncharacterized protein EI97DRAFT_468704 [Westerdykella ornata]KAF2274521.1 hypothetical protein EI97DRAFT_468704 [Westerdykella ornata]
MSQSRGTCLYREARLNVEPTYPGSTIAFTLPYGVVGTFDTAVEPKRTVLPEDHTDKDEDGFAKRNLACDGSIFFRRHHEYPRSFLWRLLNNRKILEVQSVDLDHDVNHDVEANLTLLLHFPTPVRPFCLAIAEPEEHDALTVFAITTRNDLYTITLHRDFFSRPAASELEIAEWCKRSAPSLFSNRIPYRLVATSSTELLVTLDDGGIVRLVKRSCGDGSWEESLYKETSWSVKNLLKWKGEQTVRFDNGDLDLSAAAAVDLSPDRNHILSVCLNHRLRAWNVASGKPGISTDLLGEPDHPNEKGASYIIDPSQSTHMAVLNVPGGVDGALYHVVTYSSKQHQFKFWGVRDADTPDQGIFDVKPEVELIPPVDELMDTTAWTLSEFVINPGPSGWRGTELWIRVRSGPSTRVFALKFNLNNSPAELRNTWRHDWVSVDPGPLSLEQLKQNTANPAEFDLDASELFEVDLVENWLEFLFYPGRFSVAALEIALNTYRRGLQRSGATQLAAKASLKERICSTVTAFAALEQNGVVNQIEFHNRLAAQWQAFYSLVKDLHKRRGEYLGLAFDYTSGTPWIISSDYLSPIRSCSVPEIVSLNSQAMISSEALSGRLGKVLAAEDRDVARLMCAASSFRKSLPRTFQTSLEREIESEILQSRSLSVVDRMELMEANCSLSQQVSDDDLSALVEDLGTSIKDITSETFMRVIDSLGPDEEGQLQRKQAARYGLSALMRVSQETIELSKSILLDLLVLVLYMQYEEDLSEDFDASEVFVQIIDELKHYAILSWMSQTVWSHQSSTGPASAHLLKTLSEMSKNSKQFPITQTVIEGILGHRAFAAEIPTGLRTQLLTYWSRVWLARTFKDTDLDTAIERIMAILLQQKEYGLAFEFSRYLPESPWATYLKGSMHLALGENDLASICFKKAAHNLATPSFSLDDVDDSFIPLDQRDSFSGGLPRYYSHVLSLFEKYKAYSFVADFARLGLRSLSPKKDEELKTDLLSRLFNASIQTCRIDDAYSAMMRHTNTVLRSAALQTLLTTLISHSQTPKLFSYSFLDLTSEVDALLLSHCHKQLNLSSGPPYHNILYAFRIARNDFRGAASILHDKLVRLKNSSSQKVQDPKDQTLARTYLMVLNALACVSKDDAYVLAEVRGLDVVRGGGAAVPGGSSSLNGSRGGSSAIGGVTAAAPAPAPPQWGIGKAKKLLKRRVVTLDMLRKEYQAELDRVEAIETGNYPFVEAGDEMDIL